MSEQMQRVPATGLSGEVGFLWLYKGYEIYRDNARSWSVFSTDSPNPLVRTFSRRACVAYIDRLDEWGLEEWVEFWAGFYETDG